MFAAKTGGVNLEAKIPSYQENQRPAIIRFAGELDYKQRYLEQPGRFLAIKPMTFSISLELNARAVVV